MTKGRGSKRLKGGGPTARPTQALRAEHQLLQGMYQRLSSQVVETKNLLHQAQSLSVALLHKLGGDVVVTQAEMEELEQFAGINITAVEETGDIRLRLLEVEDADQG